MKLRSIYIVAIENIKTATNFILYPIIKTFIKILNLENFQVFSDSNGWFFTIRYKQNIFKFRWIFTFLRSGFNYILLKNNIEQLQKSSNYKKITPPIHVNNYFIKQEYIENSTDFDSYVSNISSSESKVDFFIKVIDLVDKLHGCGLSHGDLKPKNILVKSDGWPFLVDLEFLSSKQVYNQERDVQKLFDRALPWLSLEEVDALIQKIGEQHIVSKVIYRRKESVGDFEKLLRDRKNVTFEKKIYDSNEDIDITVENYFALQEIVKELKSKEIKFQVHYCFCDDIKIYLYSGCGIKVLDVHLNEPISVYLLIIKKFFYNKILNIYITGPDGVGKSTLIDGFFSLNSNNLVNLFNLNKIHANRFVKTNTILDGNRFWSYFTHRFFGGIFAKKSYIYYSKIRSKAKANLFDRSLADSIVQYNKDNIFYRFFVRFVLRKDVIILLLDNPENILGRKKEMTSGSIFDYYNYFESIDRTSFKIKVVNISESNYKLSSTITYLLLNAYR